MSLCLQSPLDAAESLTSVFMSDDCCHGSTASSNAGLCAAANCDRHQHQYGSKDSLHFYEK